MEWILLLLAVLFLLWKIKGDNEDENRKRWDSQDDCDISRAMWDPSCPMYHAFNDHWDSSNNNWWSSSNDWDSDSSSWNSWGSSSWDS